MCKKTITTVFLILLAAAGAISRACAKSASCKSVSTCSVTRIACRDVNDILKNLSRKTTSLKTYRCRIEYLFSQPLLESQSLRKGDLYYKKCDKKKTKLRINFQTLKQDDEKEQNCIEQYIFDGLWLTHIDYPNKHLKKRQLAEPNSPADAFDLINQNFPLVGFNKVDDLKKQFKITLIEQKNGNNNSIQLHLVPTGDSIYKDDYSFIDCRLDGKLFLPAKITAATAARPGEEDIYQIKLVEPKVNEKIAESAFDCPVPQGFDKPEIIPLKQKGAPK